MLQFQVIGNLGADAEVKNENGRSFVSFNVGHNDRWTDADGVSHESTTWVSCALNGDGGKLLPYLRKGRCVYVAGRGSARAYSSAKARTFVAGLNIMVDRIELVGASPDGLPRQLVTEDGVVMRVHRAGWVDAADVKSLGIKNGESACLHTPEGEEFVVDNLGWVKPMRSNAEK